MTHEEAAQIMNCPANARGHFVGNHGLSCYRCGMPLHTVLEAQAVLKDPQLKMRIETREVLIA